MKIKKKNYPILKDNSIMPWGQYKGQRMIDIPDSYLLYIWRENRFNRNSSNIPVLNYIEDSFSEKDLND